MVNHPNRKKAKIVYVCPKCGSADVTSDGLLRWNVPRQRWETCSVLDNSTCESCGMELKYLAERAA